MATFINVPLASGGTAPINPETVDSIEDVPPALNAGPPACYVSFIADGSAARVVALGTAAAIAALLGTAPPPPGPSVDFGGYGPAGTPVGVSPISLIASQAANWHRIGNIVVLSARFVVTFGSSGTAQFTFPGPVQAPLLQQVRGTVVSADDPYTGGGSFALVGESGTDFLVTLANVTGTQQAVDVLLMYMTP